MPIDATRADDLDDESRWAPLRAGWITASGAPSRARLATWPARGVTHVLTLQRGDEMPAWLPSQCDAHGLVWMHLPLSGRRLDRPGDRAGLALLPHLLTLWDEPRRVVVHCAAGLHRTGAVCYLLLRCSGLPRDEAVARLREARALTADELCRVVRSGALVDQMEAVLARLEATGAAARPRGASP